MTSTNQILRVVTDFLKAHDDLTTKYWPMVDIFVERLERGIPERKIAADFHRAYRQAKRLKPDDGQLPRYWYVIVNQIQGLATKGRPWIEQHRAKGFGFWKLLELAALEPLKKSRPKVKNSLVNNEHYRYFLEDHPAEFPFLCAVFLENKRLPDLAKGQKDWDLYERLCVRMLNILLNDATFFFNPKHNWPDICQRILGQIKPAQFPAIIDIETS